MNDAIGILMLLAGGYCAVALICSFGLVVGAYPGITEKKLAWGPALACGFTWPFLLVYAANKKGGKL